MLKKVNLADIFIYFNISCWLSLLIINVFTLLDNSNSIEFGSGTYLRALMLSLFFLFTFFYYQYRFFGTDLRLKSKIDLLTATFITVSIALLTSLIVKLFGSFIKGNDVFKLSLQDSIHIQTYFYHIQIGLIVVALTKIFTLWKKMILFQKTKRLTILWSIFEYSLLGIFILNFFYLQPNEMPFIIILGYFVLLIIPLSSNLRWVAYLNFKEKWQSILLILLLGFSCLYFVWLMRNYSETEILATDLSYNIYIWVILIFIFVYALFSILVLLFNLPTSAVFEKKFAELLNFQSLIQSLQMGYNANKMYVTLLDNSSKTTMADAGWLEIRSEKGNVEFSLQNNIDKDMIFEVTKSLRLREKSKKDNNNDHLSINFLSKETSSILLPFPYNSVIEVPLIFQEKKLGNLILLKKDKEGFDNENVEIVNTFAQLASIAIENARLVDKALENERYQEALNIAKDVQQNLLPKELINNEHFEMSAFSQFAQEVGGDYYDVYPVTENRCALIIADVSGKGTSAAFYMAQMKGIFQSLVELDLSPDKFLLHTNSAISRSLEKAFFVTASFFLIDSVSKTIHFSRAGHCPTLYYHFAKQRADYIQDKGFALGMLRKPEYINYIQNNSLNYSSGDLLFLYTDGVVEAKNINNEEYGYDRLQMFLQINSHLSVHQFTNNLLVELHGFCGNRALEDDYTFLLIRFL